MKQTTPILVEICIPTYCRADRLDSLLRSIDTFLGASSYSEKISVLVSDNASSDHTRAIMESWSIRKSNWRMVYQLRNLGSGENFNFLVENSVAPYIWLFGDDDIIGDPEAVDRTFRLLEDHQPDLLVMDSLVAGLNFGHHRLYPSTRAYLKDISRIDPQLLIRHTWITANIFRRSVFDSQISAKKLETFYSHMYGLFYGLRKSGGRVMVCKSKPAEAPDVVGFKESSNPTFKRIRYEWFRYLLFLSWTYRLTQLWLFALRYYPFRQRLLSIRPWLGRLFQRLWKPSNM